MKKDLDLKLSSSGFMELIVGITSAMEIDNSVVKLTGAKENK